VYCSIASTETAGRQTGRSRKSEAEVEPRALVGGEEQSGERGGVGAARVAYLVERRRVEARAAASGVIDDVYGRALAHEPGRPALAPVGRGLVGHAGVIRSVHHHHGRAVLARRDAVVHVHLVHGDLSRRGRPGDERRAGIIRRDGLAVDEKGASSSRVKGPPRVAARAGAKPEARIAIARVKLEHVFIVDSFGRSCESSGPRPDPLPRHLRKRGNSKERHIALDLFAQEPDPVAHAGFRADRAA